MDNPDEYNGWPNRETWAFAMWVNNDEGLIEDVLEIGRRSKERSRIVGAYVKVGAFAVELQDWAEELFNDWWVNPANYPRDIRAFIREVGSLWRVDWYELAESWANDIAFEDHEEANDSDLEQSFERILSNDAS